jgi:uncharacterized coiled-coil DUF342 family protein
MYRVIYRSTRLNKEISWFQKDHKVKEIIEKFKQNKKLIYENFVLSEDELTGYYTSIWEDKDSFNEYLNESDVLEWRMTRLMFESETGCTNDLISAGKIL